MPSMPELDLGKCNLCGLCASVCKCGAIILLESSLRIIETDECGWCTLCEAVCPLSAIVCPYEITFGDGN